MSMKEGPIKMQVKGRPVARVPEGERVYAIGDVHGRLDLLTDILLRIQADDEKRPPARTTVILIGDLIDRGPCSAQILDMLIYDRPRFAVFRFIMGNHEEAMLRSLAEGADPRANGWFQFGGIETLESYAVPLATLTDYEGVLSDELRRYVPRDHLFFLMDMEPMIQIGDYVFVHAGIQPGLTLDKQDLSEMRWIREPFLSDTTCREFVVVHGHTIAERPVFRRNRIGIDTGAYRTDRLTAIGLERDRCWLIQTSAELELDALPVSWPDSLSPWGQGA
jgi:serine/threonine protein phosphatase 1